MAKDFHNEPGFQREQNKPAAPSVHTTDPSYRPGAPGTGGSRAGAIVLSIVAIIIAVGVGVFTWVVYNDMSAVQTKLESKNTEVDKLIENAAGKVTSVTEQKQKEMQAEITKLQDQMQTFMSENAAQLEKQKQALKQNIDDAIKDAEVRLQNLLQQTASHRQQWALEEIEYMIRLANLNLTLGQNYDQTLRLLKIADKNLATIENPELDEVRQALANDITQLSAAPDVDLVGLVAKIDSISNQVQKLSVLPNKKFTKNLATDKKAPDDANTWRQHVDKTMKNLRSMFVVRKLDGPIMPLLTPAQLVYLKENIRLKLSQAEWAALHHEPALYKQNLQIASEWLNHYKNHDMAAVKSLQAQLVELEKVNVKPERPKVLASLTQIASKLGDVEMPTTPTPTLKPSPSSTTSNAPVPKPEATIATPAAATEAEQPSLHHAGAKEADEKVEPKDTSDQSADQQAAPSLVFEEPGDANKPAASSDQKTTEEPKAEASAATAETESTTAPQDADASSQTANTSPDTVPGFKSPESIANSQTSAADEKRVEQEVAAGGNKPQAASADNPFVTSNPNSGAQ